MKLSRVVAGVASVAMLFSLSGCSTATDELALACRDAQSALTSGMDLMRTSTSGVVDEEMAAKLDSTLELSHRAFVLAPMKVLLEAHEGNPRVSTVMVLWEGVEKQVRAVCQS